MPGRSTGKSQKRQRIAALVGRPVGVAAIRRRQQRGIIGRRLRPRAPRPAVQQAVTPNAS